MVSELGRLEGALYRHLAIAGGGSLALGFVLGRPTWGFAAALGFLATIAYFGMLGRQVERTLSRGRLPVIGQVVALMLGRQAVCLLAIYLALRFWQSAWWACFLALLVGRNWVMIVATLQGSLKRESC